MTSTHYPGSYFDRAAGEWRSDGPLASRWMPGRIPADDAWPFPSSGAHRHHYAYMPGGCYETGECFAGPETQESLVDAHQDPVDGLGGCHYLHHGFTCERCGRYHDGAASHGPARPGSRVRAVYCNRCVSLWLSEMADRRALDNAKPPPKRRARKVRAIVVEEVPTLGL